MKLFVRPNDVLFFRDGRPFDAGGDHVARLQFPPNPGTFYGAIRAALIGQSVDNFQAFRKDAIDSQLRGVVGCVVQKKDGDRGRVDEVKHGSLQIVDFGLAIKNGINQTRLFPIPADITLDKESKAYFLLNPEKVDSQKRKTNFPNADLCLLSNPATGDKILESPGGFLTEKGLKAYLSRSQLEAGHFVETDSVFQREYRMGIERSTVTMTAEEGQLYSIEFARLNVDVGFCVEVAGMTGLEDTFKRHSLLRLGGESRSARYEGTTWNPLGPPAITNGRFKLVLLTPAIFNNGWIPDQIDTSTLTGTIAGCSAKLIAAAVGKPVGIGGWDIVLRQSKAMRRAVPAGSVYYFACTEETQIPSLEKSGFLRVGEDQFTKQGLGQAIIGTWNYIGEQ